MKNIEKIVKQAQQGDQTAFSSIVLTYTNIIKSIASSMYLSSMEYEDVVQEGTIGLVKAVRSFDKDKNASFYTYANTCIKNSMYNALKHSVTKKKVPPKSKIPFEEEAIEIGGNSLLDHTSNPEKILIVQENISAIQTHIQQDLSDLEKDVLFLYLGGFSYVEIANKTNTTQKSVDNALQRVRKKLIHFQN